MCPGAGSAVPRLQGQRPRLLEPRRDAASLRGIPRWQGARGAGQEPAGRGWSQVMTGPPCKAEGGRGPGSPSAAPLAHLSLVHCCLRAGRLAVPGAGPGFPSGGRGWLRRSKWRLRARGRLSSRVSLVEGGRAELAPARLLAPRREPLAAGSGFLRLGRPVGARSPPEKRPGYRGSKGPARRREENGVTSPGAPVRPPRCEPRAGRGAPPALGAAAAAAPSLPRETGCGASPGRCPRRARCAARRPLKRNVPFAFPCLELGAKAPTARGDGRKERVRPAGPPRAGRGCPARLIGAAPSPPGGTAQPCSPRPRGGTAFTTALRLPAAPSCQLRGLLRGLSLSGPAPSPLTVVEDGDKGNGLGLVFWLFLFLRHSPSA